MCMTRVRPEQCRNESNRSPSKACTDYKREMKYHTAATQINSASVSVPTPFLFSSPSLSYDHTHTHTHTYIHTHTYMCTPLPVYLNYPGFDFDNVYSILN